VEQIAQERTWHQGKSLTPSLILPPYLRIAFIILSGFATVSVGVGVLAGYRTPLNPFSIFADVFPGQPRSAVAARGFSCPASFFFITEPGLTDETCFLNPTAGPFFQVSVITSQDLIRHITFTLRENTLTLGDLAALWGMPEVHEYGHAAFFMWSNSGVIATTIAYTGEFSLFLPVRTVYIPDASLLN